MFTAVLHHFKRLTVAEQFHALALPVKDVVKDDMMGYRVYQNPDEFVHVPHATTAAEAIAQSGIAKPLRLERLGTRLAPTLGPQLLRGEVAVEPAPEASPEASPAQEEVNS